MEFLKRLPLLLALALLVSACESETDERQRTVIESEIRIKPPVFIDTDLLSIKAPVNGSVINDIENSPLIVNLHPAGIRDITYLFFSEEPVFGVDRIINFASSCVAGLSSLAPVYSYALGALSFDAEAADSPRLFRCQDDPYAFLDLQSPVSIDHNLFPLGDTVYWIALGYDANGLLTHSSALSKFTVGP